MCGRCLREGDAFVPRRKRPRTEAEGFDGASGGRSSSPLLLRPRHSASEDMTLSAPRHKLLSVCACLPAEEGRPACVPLPPCCRLPTVRLLVDFCTRHHNVNGRAASVDIAWRKAMRPQLQRSSECAELLRLAWYVGCAPLERLCLAELVRDLRESADTATLRARHCAASPCTAKQDATGTGTTSTDDAGAESAMPLAEALGGAHGLQLVFDAALDDVAGGAAAHAWLREAAAVDGVWQEAASAVLDARLARERRCRELGLDASVEAAVDQILAGVAD